jgi:tRNA-dihydrouridine synthase B
MNKLFEKKIIGLAPMAGFTDSPFRILCKKYGADLVYSEMISARGVLEEWKNAGKKDPKSLQLARFQEIERPIMIQLFGNEAEIIAEAAKILVEKCNPEGIDINMGCPARKVIANDYGSSLLKDPELAFEVVKNVKKVVPNKIVSVKTRLGWENKEEILEFAQGLENAGVDFLAIHGRTKIQGFSGEADWEMIGKVKEKVKIPILANGGINNFEDGIECLKVSGADGILIGQGVLGHPWIFEEINCGKLQLKEFADTAQIAREHIILARDYYFIELRKHLLHYFKSFPNSAQFREKICKCNDISDFDKIVREFSSGKA